MLYSNINLNKIDEINSLCVIVSLNFQVMEYKAIVCRMYLDLCIDLYDAPFNIRPFVHSKRNSIKYKIIHMG